MPKNYEHVVGDSIYRWLSHPGVEEIRMRLTTVDVHVILTFVLRINPDYDIDETLEEVTEHLTEEHKKVLFVTATYGTMHFKEDYESD